MTDNILDGDKILKIAYFKAEDCYDFMKRLAEKTGCDASVFHDPQYRNYVITYLGNSMASNTLDRMKEDIEIALKAIKII